MPLITGTLNYDYSGRRRKPLRKSQNSKNLRGVSNPRAVSAYRRETPDYPSTDSGSSCTAKTESLKYTGTLVKGISTMHKSNAVPIINDQEAKDIARMRR